MPNRQIPDEWPSRTRTRARELSAEWALNEPHPPPYVHERYRDLIREYLLTPDSTVEGGSELSDIFWHDLQAAHFADLNSAMNQIQNVRGGDPGDPRIELIYTFENVSREVKGIIHRMSADPSSTITRDELFLVGEEVARLTSRTWVSPEWSEAPQICRVAFGSIATLAGTRMAPFSRFNERQSIYQTMTYDDISDDFADHFVAKINGYKSKYFSEFPLPGPLPNDHALREIEETERVTNYSLLLARTQKVVIDEIVQPLIASKEAQAEFEAREEKTSSRRSSSFRKPEPQEYGVSHRGAEAWIHQAVQWLGASDAVLTQQSRDGGVDVESSLYAVSVKNYSGTVPVEEVREIYGVAHARGKTPLMFTSGTLTKAALEFAETASVAVVTYDVTTATFSGLNSHGADVLRNGLSPN